MGLVNSWREAVGERGWQDMRLGLVVAGATYTPNVEGQFSGVLVSAKQPALWGEEEGKKPWSAACAD